MTDKVQKIREEVEKLHGNPYYMMAVKDVLEILDMQEEPVSKELKVELEKYIKDHFTIDTEQLDRFGIEEKDYMYSMDKSDMLALVEYFTNWQKTKDEFTTEDLEDYINELSKQFPEVSFAKLSRIAVRVAKWQKEQIMAKAIDGVVTFDYYDSDDKTYGCVAHDSFCLEDFGLKDRDKVKVIVIKEDRIMRKAEKFIEEHIKTCSNQYDFPEYFENGIKRLKEYQPWLTPDQARMAVEIAREEIYEWLDKNIYMYNGECEGDRKGIINDLKQAMKDE